MSTSVRALHMAPCARCERPDENHAANKIVGVACGIGGHSKHIGSGTPPPMHYHLLEYKWYDSQREGDSGHRVIQLRCTLPREDNIQQHDSSTSNRSRGEYATNVEFANNRFTFSGGSELRLAYDQSQIEYCNGLIAAGNNSGAYPPFSENGGVPDICETYFSKSTTGPTSAIRPHSGGL